MGVAAALTKAEEESLLEQYVPELRYDSQSAFRAVAASTATDNPGNRLVRRRQVLAAASGVPFLSLATLAGRPPGEAAEPPADGELDPAPAAPADGVRPPKARDRIVFGPDPLRDARRMQAEAAYGDRVYVRAVSDEGRLFLQYWLWFYSVPPREWLAQPRSMYAVADSAEGGDWRFVQVQLGAGRQPECVVLSGPRNERRAWADVTKSGGRPVVFVSPLTQMLFFAPGIAWRGDGWDGSDGDGRVVVPDVEQFGRWQDWPGRWGRGRSGRRSPGLRRAWKRPARAMLPAPVRGLRDAGLALVFPFASRQGPPAAPMLSARLERSELVVNYELSPPRPVALLVTVHRTGDGEAVGRTVAPQLHPAARVRVSVPKDLDECDVRICALQPSGNQRRILLSGIKANDPDDLERAILRGVVERQARERDMQEYGGRYGVSAEQLAEVIGQRSKQVWETVATDLQAFRDERTAQTRREDAAAAARQVMRVAVGGGLAFVVAVIVIGLATVLDSGLLATLGGMLVGGAVTALGTLIPGVRTWRGARARLRLVPQQVLQRSEAVPLAGARRAFERALAEKAVAPLMRAAINEKTIELYAAPLDVGARGLSELRVAESEIETEATRRLAAVVGRMRGGSIGIAGPRGVGKSTLIRSYLQPRTVGDRRLTVEVTAPVRYDARDFILTLYAQLCDRVLHDDRGRPVDPGRGARAPRISWAAGLVVLCLVLILGAAATPSRDLELVAAGLAGAALAAAVGTIVRVHWRRFWVSVVCAGGLAAVLVGLLVHGGDAAAHLIAAVVLIAAALGVGSWSRRRGAARASARPEDRLRAHAEASRENIRFQQSWSHGYSGKFSVPLGAEIGAQQQSTFERRQTTLPELVDDFRGFVETAVEARGEVAIGIDEMDKMESAAVAEQFLNEIKAIFGVEGCFYLVSISENAMSSFERRGLPFRDAFDSSFDEVLTLTPLPLHDAKRLLRGRVLGLAPPFLDLAHCLSGGLGRDLLRVTRRLSLYEDGDRQIQAVARTLVREELEAKVDAIGVRARDVGLEAHGQAFHLWLATVRRTRIRAGDLRRAAGSAPEGWPPRPPEDPEQAARLEELQRLWHELTGFTYYLAALTELFAGEGDPAALFVAAEAGEAKGQSIVDELARARAAFAVSPAVAKVIVDRARRRKKWPRSTGPGADGGPPAPAPAAGNGAAATATA